jgi:hypothetical protein
MDQLNELIYIFNKDGHDTLDTILPEGSGPRRLFDIIVKHKSRTDEDAIQLLNEETDKKEDYAELKNALANTLLESIFHANVSEQENQQDHVYKGKKDLMIAEQLLNQNVYHTAEKIILEVKRHAEEFQALELQIDCAKHLRTVYTLKGYPKEVEYYNLVLKRLNAFFQHEQEAIGFIDLLESKIKYAIGKYREIAVEAQRYSSQVREWQKASGSPALKLYQYKIELTRCYHTNDTREWAYILGRLQDLLNKYPFLRTDALTLYISLEWAKHMRCVANIPEAIHYMESALQQSDYAAFNKFEVQALNFDLQIKEKKHEDAGQILAEVKACLQFPLLEAQDQAAWLLREAYLYFIFSSLDDKKNIELYTPVFTTDFPMSNLANSCKAITGDKKGYNFMLVIIKELFAMQKQGQRPTNENNSLLGYYQQHMKDACEERSKAFIKKLAKACRSESITSKEKPETKTSVPKTVAKNFDAAELVPYEHLYELLIARQQVIH